MNYPDLLILDEPAASLDPLGRRDVLEVMERLRKYSTVFYSTHILDDVQKVSDTVAILNRGELVAFGSIETLLEGSSGTAYTVKFKGDARSVRERLSGQAWVSQVEASESNGEISLTVSVSDQQAAETKLARVVLADEGISLTEFKRKTYDLEDIFMEIIEGGSHGRK